MAWLAETARYLLDLDVRPDPSATPILPTPANILMPSPRPRSPASEEPTPEAAQRLEEDPESFRAVAAIAYREYANENSRTDVLNGRGGTLVGATGAAIAFIVGAIIKPPDTINGHPLTLGVGFYGAVVVSLVLLVIAQILFLCSILLRGGYRRLDLGGLVDYAVMRQPPWYLYATFASSYQDAVAINTTLNDRKAVLQGWGVFCLLLGTIALAVIPASILWVVAGR